jgi:CBS domain containing-hemolysin-like protein
VHYINEADDLHAALDAFNKTRAPLLVVVNNFEEVAGVLTLDDVLSLILGRKIESGFYDYHDLKSVAGRTHDKN